MKKHTQAEIRRDTRQACDKHSMAIALASVRVRVRVRLEKTEKGGEKKEK